MDCIYCFLKNSGNGNFEEKNKSGKFISEKQKTSKVQRLQRFYRKLLYDFNIHAVIQCLLFHSTVNHAYSINP